MIRHGSLLAGISARLPEEVFEILAQGPNARMERIVSHGHASPPDFWYDQETSEWVLVVQGRAGVELSGGDCVELGPGDWLNIPAHCRHRVAWTAQDEPTVWLAVHY
jgi:cupin 2 domain-containing protein